MNPLGIVVVALGVMLIIVGVSGSQHKLVSALTGKAAKSTNTTAFTVNTQTSPTASGATTAAPA